MTAVPTDMNGKLAKSNETNRDLRPFYYITSHLVVAVAGAPLRVQRLVVARDSVA